MNIPSINKCYELMDRFKMLENIKQHSLQVTEVARLIIDHTIPGIGLHKDLIIASALLHDITKTASLTTHEPHDKSGSQLLRKFGYPEIADIVAEHVTLSSFNPDGPLLDKEIVYYADKRVKHDMIVSVEERINDLLDRYGDTDEKKAIITNTKKIILQLEKKINNYLTKDLSGILSDYHE